MQALTIAISPSGLQNLGPKLIGSQLANALSGLRPPSFNNNPPNNGPISIPDIIYTPPGGPPPPASTTYNNITISLSNGFLSNMSATVQSLTQGANGQFTFVLVASNFTVSYDWNEQFDEQLGFAPPSHKNFTWYNSQVMSVGTLTVTVPLTLAQQGNSYTLTFGSITTTTSGLNPTAPANSVVWVSTSPCDFVPTLDTAVSTALREIDFTTPVQNVLLGLFGTLPASGQLTSDIVFNFNQGDTPLAFPGDQGITLGVTGNTTWEGNAYPDGTPPSLGIPGVPADNHVHFYAADYQFNELFWAFFKDNKLNTTITGADIPPGDPHYLNTNFYVGTSLNALAVDYPNLPMSVDVSPMTSSTVTFQSVYDVVYGNNGALTTMAFQVPDALYEKFATLAGAVYLDQPTYTAALQSALGSDGAQYIAQIIQASTVVGTFAKVYQVTQTGLNSLQQQLPSGVYNDLNGALTVGQVFVDQAWLLAAVENALGTLALANQYAQQIEAAFAVAGTYNQVYWVTPGTNGCLTTLVDQLPADVYNDVATLENTVYTSQTALFNDLENVIGADYATYSTQIANASRVTGAVATHNVQAVFNVIKEGNKIQVFAANYQENDFQQDFRLGISQNNQTVCQTVQFDFQIIPNTVTSRVLWANIKGISADDLPSIWKWALQPVYQKVNEKMAHTGVPLPFMAGLRFLFNQATVAIKPGYADVLADVEFVGTAQTVDALARDPNSVDLASLAGQIRDSAGRRKAPEPVRMGAAGGRRSLVRTKASAARTRLVRRGELRGGPAASPGEPETFDFHFALGHLPGVESFHLHTGGERIPLTPHTPQTLAAHAERDAALGLLDEQARATFTHYVEGVQLSPERARILRVTYPSATAPIPELALLAVHVPRWARQAHRKRRLQRDAQGVPVNLAHLGVATRLSYARALAAADDADQLVTTTSTAATLVFMHPQLATSNPTTAGVVMDHINSPANITNIQRFQTDISRQGKNWQSTAPSTDINGNNLVWGPSFRNAGQPVYRNKLSVKTIGSAGGAMKLPLTTSQQDPLLENSSWSVNQGTGAVYHIAPEAARKLRAGRARIKAAVAAANGGYAFTLNNLTPGFGLDIDDSSLSFTPDNENPGAGTVTVNVTNTFLRSLYAYVQFLDDHNNVIQVPDTQGPGYYVPIDVVTPVNVILGIPAPTEPTVLTFDWPAGAASARLVHGGLGTSRWDNDIVWPGAILTGIFNYAIPGIFLVAGAELDNNAWLKTIEEEKPLVAKLLSLGLSVFGAEASASVAFPDVSAILSAMDDAIAGFLVHEGLEKLQEFIVEKLGETALEDAIPGVDVFFEIANRALDLAEVAETTIEVLGSPAVYEVDIVRTLDLQATVSPDPTHGTSINPAIWPQSATTWQAIVQYNGGTAHTQTGSMLGLSSRSQPITVTFDALPAGGSLQVKFNVYSASGFLCGQYTSAWQPAALPDDEDMLTVVGSIQENLVPLSPATVYEYDQKLVYDGATNAHVWQPSQFTIDLSLAGSLDSGQVSPAVQTAFQQQGCTLSSGASINVINPGSAWTITDGQAVYRIARQQVTVNDQTVVVLMVNTGNIPLQVVTDLNADDTGNNLAKLVNITMNDKAYMLGYCWRASGQNIPETGGGFPVSGQIHAFQNINVLANPEASLKFPSSGFTNQPAIVYDQFGPAPLFSVPGTLAAELDQGGTVAADLATLFKAFNYPLPADAVVAATTPGAAWTIGVPGTVPAYSLSRVTDVIEVHPYPSEAVSQRNYYVQPTSDSPSAYQYHLRQVVLDNTTPFDMAQTQSWGRFTLPFNDDFVVHPQGYVIAVSYTQSRMMILKLPDAAAPDDQVDSAVIASGPAGTTARQGLMNGPTALAVTADGRVLVLEQGTSQVPGRIQSFDVNANPVPSFDGRLIATVPVAYAADLDAGLVSAALRQTMANAGAPLSAVWLVQDGTTLYQLAEASGGFVITSGGADLSLNWTVKSGTNTYQLNLDGPNITVSQNGTVLFTMPASLAASLNAGITSGDVAALFRKDNIALTAPVSITGDQLVLDPTVVADLIQGTVPAPLFPALSARGLPVPANPAVSGSVVVTVREPGSLWTLQDLRTSTSYKISARSDGTGLDVVEFVSTMPLYDYQPGAGVTYLSMSTELKGYIYVLSYTGDGSSVTDYRLDIYQPNGPWLARTQGVNAAKIVVDMWRNLYTLNYESLLGPGGRTEPSVSTWIPSS
jgi:hypothetical protein